MSSRGTPLNRRTTPKSPSPTPGDFAASGTMSAETPSGTTRRTDPARTARITTAASGSTTMTANPAQATDTGVTTPKPGCPLTGARPRTTNGRSACAETAQSDIAQPGTAPTERAASTVTADDSTAARAGAAAAVDGENTS
ncbi:hypothetical protein, partial [Nocardia concava]|uniref:hypothetical protein n=1 Tax=Nocardia concava TaxID=257281 RepID=UPI001C3F38A7